MATHYLAIEIGGTKLQLVTGEAPGVIHERRRFQVERHRGAQGIRQHLEQSLPDLLARWRPAAIGVGFGGPVDWRAGRICRSHQIEGWSEFDLGKWLGALTALPVAVENDANLAAYGEALHGAGRGFNPVLYVTLGSGVGAGLVVDDKIYHGAIPGEAELGHLRLDRQGAIVENRCSGWAVDEKIRRLKLQQPDSLLARLASNSVAGEARFLAPALEANDAAALAVLRETASDLAFALSHAIHLFHPEVIVLGGGLALVGEPLRAAVAAALPGLLMEVFGAGPAIRLALLKEDAVPVGGLVLAARLLAG